MQKSITITLTWSGLNAGDCIGDFEPVTEVHAEGITAAPDLVELNDYIQAVDAVTPKRIEQSEELPAAETEQN